MNANEQAPDTQAKQVKADRVTDTGEVASTGATATTATPATGTLEFKNANPKSSLSTFLASRLRQVGLFIALIVIVILFQFLTNGALITPQNVTSLIGQNAYVLILAIGMVLVIIAGHIDLSVGSVVAFVGAATGVMIRDWGFPWWAAILGGLVVGALIGAWQGFWVAYFGIPAFIVTLAGMLLFRGLTQMLLHNVPITPFPAEYNAIGTGFIPDTDPSTTPLAFVTLIVGVLATIAMVLTSIKERRTRVRYGLEDEPMGWFILKNAVMAVLMLGVTFLLAQNRGMPIVLIILAVLVLVYSIVMNRTVFGRQIYARGGNLAAARLSGINVKRLDFLVFVNMGVLAAIAGIAFTARSNSALPGAGNGFELDAIAAVFIGGAAVTGGVGTVMGAIIGGLIMGVLNSGMSLLGLGSDVQQFIKGLVLLAAVAFDVFNKRRAGAGS